MSGNELIGNTPSSEESVLPFMGYNNPTLTVASGSGVQNQNHFIDSDFTENILSDLLWLSSDASHSPVAGSSTSEQVTPGPSKYSQVQTGRIPYTHIAPDVEFIDLTDDTPSNENASFDTNKSRDDRFNILKDILPDADTTFLRQKLYEIHSEIELQNFVLDAVAAQNYPKKGSIVVRNDLIGKTKESKTEQRRVVSIDPVISVPSTSGTFAVKSTSSALNLTTYSVGERINNVRDKMKAVPVMIQAQPVLAADHFNAVTRSVYDAPHTVTSRALPHTITSTDAAQGATFRVAHHPPTLENLTVTTPRSANAVPRPVIVGDHANSVNIPSVLRLTSEQTTVHGLPTLQSPVGMDLVDYPDDLLDIVPSIAALTADMEADTDGPWHVREDLLLQTANMRVTDELEFQIANDFALNIEMPHIHPQYNHDLAERSVFELVERDEMGLDLRARINRQRHHRDDVRTGNDNIDYSDTGVLDPSLDDLDMEKYQKIKNILVGAKREYLVREVSKLKTDDDVEKFLLKAFADQSIWKRHNNVDDVAGHNSQRLTPRSSKYKILLELLPDASPSYLKKECARLFTDGDVQNFALKLLREKNYPKRRTSQSSSTGQSLKRKLPEPSEIPPPDPKYLTLADMLPDADPDFLLEMSKNLADENDLERFALEIIEKNSYPKREQFLQRQEHFKQWKKYIEEFDVKEFVLLFPNPIKHFYFENKNSKNSRVMLMYFLQHRYKRKSNHTFFVTYNNADCNLTKTCDRLDEYLQVTPRKFKLWDGKTDFSIPILQEIAFIQNKKEIVQYILFQDTAKSEAYEKAKTEGSLLECGCCYDEYLSEDVQTCNAGHIFCLTCIKRGSEVAIGNGKTSFPCYNDECEEEFPLDVINKVLTSEVFSRLLVRKQYEEVNAAGIQGLETCSFCEFCSIPAPEDKLFRCLNPTCMKVTCRLCKKIDHLPLTCEEFVKSETQKQMLNYVEDKMTEALVRTCWQCKTKFVKESGCNMMQCKCGAKMCYACRQPVQNYDHFSHGRCSQHMDMTHEDAKTVHEAGKRAKEEVEAANPGFHLENDLTHTKNSHRTKQKQ